jgi:hypothetical protein
MIRWIEMGKTIATRDRWHPQTAQDRDAILRELHEVLASPHFCNSKRYPALLQYIVENTLAGKSDLLKERTLGVEVFDRPATYDTNTDTVVRYTAGEVRKRLQLYYHERGRAAHIRIALPAGSYIPEFLLGPDEPDEAIDGLGRQSASVSSGYVSSGSVSSAAGGDAHLLPEPVAELRRAGPIPLSAASVWKGQSTVTAELLPMPSAVRVQSSSSRRLWLLLIAVIAVGAMVGWGWKFRAARPQGALEDFWGPVLRDQRTVLICSGSVVFAPNRTSGTLTAGKDIEYPFVSMEGASAISLISGLLEHFGAPAQLQSAGTTSLSQLREHSFILLGAFNNQWTLRLLEPLRFHFMAGPDESIVDQMQPQIHWSRDPALPYSSADDFALLARYRDRTTGSWVVALAGVGRNGTEAAAQFATSPHYMQMLREQMGGEFSNRNIEAVLKVSVIDGKTGAPSILAVQSW